MSLQVYFGVIFLANLAGTQANKLFLIPETHIANQAQESHFYLYPGIYDNVTGHGHDVLVQENSNGTSSYNSSVKINGIFVSLLIRGSTLEENGTASINSQSGSLSKDYSEIIEPTVTLSNFRSAISLSRRSFSLTNLKSYYAVPFCLILSCGTISWLIWTKAKTSKNVLDSDSDREQRGGGNTRTRKQYIFCVLMVLFELFRSCYTRGISGLIVTYVIKHLKVGKTTASNIASTFFAATSVAPIPMVFLLRYIHPRILLGVSLVVTTITMVITLLLVDRYVFLVWIWATLCGACVTVSEVPCYSWYSEKISKTSATETSYLMTAYALGSMIGPGVTGLAMSWQNPAWYMHSLLGMVILADGMYMAVFIADRRNVWFEGHFDGLVQIAVTPVR